MFSVFLCFCGGPVLSSLLSVLLVAISSGSHSAWQRERERERERGGGGAGFLYLTGCCLGFLLALGCPGLAGSLVFHVVNASHSWGDGDCMGAEGWDGALGGLQLGVWVVAGVGWGLGALPFYLHW